MAYASYYNDITKGYKDGTREVYIRDDNEEKGYRRATREDELKELDKAYNDCCKDFEEYVQRQQKNEKLMEKHYKELLNTKGVRSEKGVAFLNELEEKRQKGEEHIPKNISEVMKNAGQSFLSKYLSSMKENSKPFHQILSSIHIW